MSHSANISEKKATIKTINDTNPKFWKPSEKYPRTKEAKMNRPKTTIFRILNFLSFTNLVIKPLDSKMSNPKSTKFRTNIKQTKDTPFCAFSPWKYFTNNQEGRKKNKFHTIKASNSIQWFELLEDLQIVTLIRNYGE